MAYYSHQARFNNGEVTPFLASRSDTDFWQASLLECTNFNVLIQGGLRRRSGTIFVTEVADSSQKSRLIPFVFNSEQAYVLDVNGSGTIRFVADRAYLQSGGSPYAISHPWSASDIPLLSIAQLNDVMYVACKTKSPRKITRHGDVNWSIEQSVFNDGPYLEPDDGVTTYFNIGGYGLITPIMTSNTAPEGVVSSNTGSADAYKIFDGLKSTHFINPTSNTGWISYQLASGSRICDAYWLRATSSADPSGMIASWELQGWDGSNWVTVDARSNESGWGRGEIRFYEFSNSRAFSQYRLEWFGTNYTGDSETTIAELGLHWEAEDQTPFSVSASSTAFINGGAGFQASDVGRSLRLMGSDGRWRWAKIVSVVNSTGITVRLYNHGLPDALPISQWRLGAFSDQSGWPGSVSLFNERLMWARTDSEPVTVYGSKQSQFDDYGVSVPAVETDGLKLTLLSSNMNEILWISDDQDLITGSAGQIRSIGPADFTKSFSATNLTQKKGPTNGAFYLQPITIGGVTLYVGAGGKKIRELLLGDQNRYVAPDLSVLCEHLLKSGVVSWGFSENPDPTIYLANGDGELISIAYDRDQKVVGAARHEIAGGFVESVAVIPGVTPGVDDVYLCVRRTINGQTKRYIEVLDNPFDGQTMGVEDGFFVDCGLKYSGAPITTVTGLTHLEGEKVLVLADGGAVYNLTVSGGSITLPYAASKISVGLAYKSRAVTLPVSGPQQDGSLFGRRINVVGAAIDVLDSASMHVGAYGSDDWTPPTYQQLMKRGDMFSGSAPQLESGFKPVEIEGSWAGGNGSIVIESDDPLPLLIRSVVMQLENEP